MHTTLRAAFTPWMVAGVRTQWDNMLPYLSRRPGMEVRVAEIHPHLPGGLLERLPLPPVARGNLRSMGCTLGLLHSPRIDVIWTHEVRALLPYLLSRRLLDRTPIVFTTDSTSAQQAEFGGFYAKAAPRSLRARVRDWVDQQCMRAAAVINPWSEWAARSLRDDYGIAPERIAVIPPGIDLDRWRPPARTRSRPAPPRLLFVGGDFRRKGGDLLLRVFLRSLSGRAELDLVTQDPVEPAPGVRVHHGLRPNAPRLLELYAEADVFVLPTRADCFSLASMEAMAAGLPVISTRVGGIPEIVEQGRSGFLIEAGDEGALLQALEALVSSAELRARMGATGRRIAEERFDAARTTGRLLDLLQHVAAQGRAPSSERRKLPSRSR
jgi:glycosyltransferase involved in cell wall biosynthesis